MLLWWICVACRLSESLMATLGREKQKTETISCKALFSTAGWKLQPCYAASEGLFVGPLWAEGIDQPALQDGPSHVSSMLLGATGGNCPPISHLLGFCPQTCLVLFIICLFFLSFSFHFHFFWLFCPLVLSSLISHSNDALSSCLRWPIESENNKENGFPESTPLVCGSMAAYVVKHCLKRLVVGHLNMHKIKKIKNLYLSNDRNIWHYHTAQIVWHINVIRFIIQLSPAENES